MQKPRNERAWLLVLPVCLVVAFSAIIPLMTVVNYSVQDIVSPEQRVYVGWEWFQSILRDPELHGAFARQELCVHGLADLLRRHRPHLVLGDGRYVGVGAVRDGRSTTRKQQGGRRCREARGSCARSLIRLGTLGGSLRDRVRVLRSVSP